MHIPYTLLYVDEHKMCEMNILLQDMFSFACRSLVEIVRIAGSAYIFVHEK